MRERTGCRSTLQTRRVQQQYREGAQVTGGCLSCPRSHRQLGNPAGAASQGVEQESTVSSFQRRRNGAAAICQIHRRCSIAPVTQETLTEMLPSVVPQEPQSHHQLQQPVLLPPLPRVTPACGQVPPQYTFPGKPLHEAASLPVRPRRGCTSPERTPPNALIEESEAGGTKAWLLHQQKMDTGTQATLREQGHLTWTQPPAPTQGFLSQGTGDRRLLLSLRAYIPQNFTQNSCEKT